jgi:hypothetical protein
LLVNFSLVVSVAHPDQVAGLCGRSIPDSGKSICAGSVVLQITKSITVTFSAGLLGQLAGLAKKNF